jgi:hypothetical protein
VTDRHSERRKNPAYTAVLDAALDAAIMHRVQLHQARKEKRIDVADYLAGLDAVRQVEAHLEPLRDATHSRAWELVIADGKVVA